MSDRKWLIAWVVVAVLSRCSAILLLDAVRHMPANAYEHGSIARYLSERQGFVFHFYTPAGTLAPTSQQAPFLPYLLATAYELFGVESSAAFWAVLLLQAVVGGLAVAPLAWATENSLGNRRAGLWAAGIAAVYPPIVASAAHYQAVTWNLAAVTLLWWGATEVRRGRSGIGWATLAGTTVFAWHVDPIIGAVGIVTMLSLVRVPGQTVRSAVLAGFFVMVGIAPWTIRNATVHGQFMWGKDSFWYVLWQGNTVASHGTDKLLSASSDPLSTPAQAEQARRQSRSVDDTMPADFREHLEQLPNEIARMNAFRTLILDEWTRDPFQYPRTCLLRLRQWLWFDETNPRSSLVAYRASYILLVITSALGMLGGRNRGQFLRTAGVILLILTLTHVLIITSARFRLPVEMLLIPWSAMGLRMLGAGRFPLFRASRLARPTISRPRELVANR